MAGLEAQGGGLLWHSRLEAETEGLKDPTACRSRADVGGASSGGSEESVWSHSGIASE